MTKKLIESKVGIIDGDGNVYAMGRSNEPGLHVVYLFDYLEEKHPECLRKLKLGSPRDRFGYVFAQIGDIIYFNDLETGMIYFPYELSAEQEKVMRELDLGSQWVAINYDLDDYGSFITSKIVGINDYSPLKKSFDEYIRSKGYHR